MAVRQRSLQHVLMEPSRVLLVMASMAIISGVFTVLSVVIPHQNDRYDHAYLAVGLGLAVFGVALRARSRRPRVTLTSVHVASFVISACVLSLTWMGMVDVGGVQAVLLLIPLVITASLGPLPWTLALLAAQSIGYGVVLATSDPVLGFDHQSQWVVVTMGLVVAVAYQDMMRRQLAAASAHEDEVRAEQEQNRRAHARNLELVNVELQNANDLKGRFVAMASHELRTPLTAISGFAATMSHHWETLQDSDKQKYVVIIEEQSARLGRLVSDLLTLSHIESGRLSPIEARVALEPILQRTLDHLDLTDIDVICDADIVVLADEDHIEQILINLLGNAMTHGAPPVRIEARVDCHWVDITVVDHGVGVPAEFVSELFTRFARGPQAGEQRGGAGLGLSIVEGLATAYGGHASYAPNEPRGSRFSVRLPAEPSVSSGDGSAAP